MKFRIWHKLALLLITITTLTVVFGLSLSHYSFRNSFYDYLSQQEQRRLTNLSNSLLLAYEENGNWEFIRNNNRLWLFYLRPRLGPFMSNNNRHRRDGSHRGPNRRLPPLALLDINKKLIVGVQGSQEKAQYLPLKSNGKIVAYLHNKKFSQITDHLDKLFANKQNHAFVINMLLAFLLSIVVALVISFFFRKRIKSLIQIARQLTSGQYQHRLVINQQDELGQLGMDFNTLAETLQKNQQSQQQWIADISHELRTPVAILKGELEAVEDGIRPLDDAAIKSLKQEIERLSKLIEDLYQLSIADMGALKYIKSAFVFKQLVEEVIDSFELRFKRQNLSLQLDNSISEQLLFTGDRQRLYQLLSNLLENSLRYTDSGGRVIIHCKENIEQLIIKVEDSSPGIPIEKMANIFDRLFRLESSRNRIKGGAGLGLAIAKQIVLAQQGKIYAERSTLGGIIITFHLPK
jgi:two-component system, OmpR family, sensor histidine kinase BaeS